MRTKESATVLIVDDNPIIRKIVAEQIALFGFQPILAASGEEALRLAKKHTQIDLLLTDIATPPDNQPPRPVAAYRNGRVEEQRYSQSRISSVGRKKFMGS